MRFHRVQAGAYGQSGTHRGDRGDRGHLLTATSNMMLCPHDSPSGISSEIPPLSQRRERWLRPSGGKTRGFRGEGEPDGIGVACRPGEEAHGCGSVEGDSADHGIDPNAMSSAPCVPSDNPPSSTPFSPTL